MYRSSTEMNVCLYKITPVEYVIQSMEPDEEIRKNTIAKVLSVFNMH